MSNKDRSFDETPEKACCEGWLYSEQQRGLLMALLRLLKAVALFMVLPTSASAADLNDLYRALLRHGFTIEERQPPGNAYGRFIPSERRLVISPLVRELGITRPVFLHEAVHAAQSCPSGRLTPLGWSAQLNPVVEREISGVLLRSYHIGDRALEREAFMLQGQRDAVPKLVKAIQQRCS